MKTTTLTLSVTLLFVVFSAETSAQLTSSFKDSAISDVLNTLTRNYVFPEVANRAKTFVLQQKSKGVYNPIATGDELARQLTTDIRQIANDLHINVHYSKDILPPQHESNEPSPEIKEEIRKMLEKDNYGIKSKNILPGNIGYINFSVFAILEFSADSLISAMQQVAETDALIIDLRENGGSMDPSTIPFLSGYFFRNPVHLNDFYNRHSNDTVQSWSYAWVPGKRYFDKPLYLLTGPGTFSGAEEFAYDFKNLKRATLIGETTKGGANPGGVIRANDHFVIFVPTGRAINPFTKTNWEGVGVQPDTVIKANRALHKAHSIALQNLIVVTNDANKKAALIAALHNVNENQPVYKHHTFTLRGFDNAKDVMVAGSFNSWSPHADKMERRGNVWTTTVDVEPGEHAYKFIVDGNWITDPANKLTKSEGMYINSLILVK